MATISDKTSGVSGVLVPGFGHGNEDLDPPAPSQDEGRPSSRSSQAPSHGKRPYGGRLRSLGRGPLDRLLQRRHPVAQEVDLVLSRRRRSSIEDRGPQPP